MAKKNEGLTESEARDMDAAATAGAEFAGVPMDASAGVDEPEDAAIADFDLGTDVKITPVAVAGTYFGSISNAKVDLKSAQILIDITLNENGGVLSDGETPNDGYVYTHRVFLPKAGDKTTMTAKGKETKWQWKVNNMAKTFAALGLSLPTLKDIIQACDDGDLVGIDVKVDLVTEEYNGELKNSAKSVVVR